MKTEQRSFQILSPELVITRENGQFLLRSMPGDKAQEEDVIASSDWNEFVDLIVEQFGQEKPIEDMTIDELRELTHEAHKRDLVKLLRKRVAEANAIMEILAAHLGLEVHASSGLAEKVHVTTLRKDVVIPKIMTTVKETL
jgi:hypothetical protein